MATSSTGLRPMMWDKEAHVGWKTVDVRRKEVPAQNASMAVPFKFCGADIVCRSG